MAKDLKGYSIEKNEKGGFSVYKNGELCDNSKGAMREMAEIIGLEVDAKWTTQQFGSKLLKAIGEGAKSESPVKKEAMIENTVTPAARKEPTPKKEAKPAKTVSSEEDALKARIAELEKELAKQKASAKEEKPAKEENTAKKSNDPFEGLMVKVCAGMFKQDLSYEEKEYYYPGGDRRKKEEFRWVKRSKSRRVTISKDFYICKYPVTQGQWKAIMGEGFNPSEFRGNDNLPVDSVSWNDCQEFIKKLNALTGKKYCLPTSAQWEWAAMGASKDDDQGKWAGCSLLSDLEQYAWYSSNSDCKTHPVGQKKPNELGLSDMCGNVCEWCQDGSQANYNIEAKDVIDPIENETCSYKIRHGGSYSADSDYITISYCSGFDFDSRNRYTGFRLALTID